MRRAALAVFAVMSMVASAAAAVRVGPSYPCVSTEKDTLAILICSDQILSRAELELVQTYYAMRQKAGVSGLGALKSELLSFLATTRQDCNIPAASVKDGVAHIAPTATQCVSSAFMEKRTAWMQSLSGEAAEEAARPAEQNIALQRRLQALGFLPMSAEIDGIFGTLTREALTTWQRVTGRAETGFFGDNDAAALVGTPVRSSAPAEANEIVVSPLSKLSPADPHRGALTATDLSTIVDTSQSNDLRFNRDFKGKFFSATGKFDLASKTTFGNGYRIFVNFGFLTSVFCTTSDAVTVNSIVDWSKGTPLTISGNIYDTRLGQLELADGCTVNAVQQNVGGNKRFESIASEIIKQFAGQGNFASRPFEVGGPWELRWNAQVGSLTIKTEDGHTVDMYLLNGAGSAYQPKGGIFYISVNAFEPWTIDIVRVGKSE